MAIRQDGTATNVTGSWTVMPNRIVLRNFERKNEAMSPARIPVAVRLERPDEDQLKDVFTGGVGAGANAEGTKQLSNLDVILGAGGKTFQINDS